MRSLLVIAVSNIRWVKRLHTPHSPWLSLLIKAPIRCSPSDVTIRNTARWDYHRTTAYTETTTV